MLISSGWIVSYGNKRFFPGVVIMEDYDDNYQKQAEDEQQEWEAQNG